MKTKFLNLSLAEQDKSKTVKFKSDLKSGVTVCRLYDRWNDRYFTGVTRCHDVDNFDERKGRAIAFNKARRKELLADLAHIEWARQDIIRQYEDVMKWYDRRESLKRIYLTGVEEELNELMGTARPVDDTAEPINMQAEPALPSETEPENIKLTQYAKFTEIE